MSNESEKTKGAVSLKVLAEDHCPEHAKLIEYLRKTPKATE